MFRKISFVFAIAALCTLLFTFYSFAQDQTDIHLEISSTYVDGKVNDPVSKRSLKASIFNDNPLLHIEGEDADFDEVEVIVYSNEYVEGEDRGIRNRIIRKTVTFGEEFHLLPEQIYEDAVEDGTIYDFVNRCFVLRVFIDEESAKYKDYYIGIVDDHIFEEMYEIQEMKSQVEELQIQKLGPAAMKLSH